MKTTRILMAEHVFRVGDWVAKLPGTKIIRHPIPGSRSEIFLGIARRPIAKGEKLAVYTDGSIVGVASNMINGKLGEQEAPIR